MAMQRHQDRMYDPDFLDRAWLRVMPAEQPGASFSILTWNLQADQTRYPRGSKGGDGGRLRPGEDRRAVEACIASLLGHGNAIGLTDYPSIIMLQELQQCTRHIRQQSCRHHEPINRCKYDHATWADSALKSDGYEGNFHNGRLNTVGLYYRPDVWENVTSPRNPLKLLYVTFDGSHGANHHEVGNSTLEEIEESSGKGAVLAVLRHRVSGCRILAASIHLSVPLSSSGEFTTSRQLGELAQLGSKIKDVLNKHGEMPVLIAGDTNSLADDTAGVAPPHAFDRLTTEWGLQSAYEVCMGGTSPPYSSVSPDFRYCIDHIVASPELIPSAVLEVKPDYTNRQNPYPSDHLPMAAEYFFSN